MSLIRSFDSTRASTAAVPRDNTDGADHVVDTALHAGERNPTSTSSNAYQVTRPEGNLTVLNSTAAVTLGAGGVSDTHLLKLMRYGSITGTVSVGGFQNSTGGSTTITIASSAAGWPNSERDFGGALNAAAALTVTLNSTADLGLVGALWRPV